MGNHMIDMCQKDIHIIEYEFVRQELYSFWHALITLSTGRRATHRNVGIRDTYHRSAAISLPHTLYTIETPS